MALHMSSSDGMSVVILGALIFFKSVSSPCMGSSSSHRLSSHSETSRRCFVNNVLDSKV
jgi:hypothetical protein